MNDESFNQNGFTIKSLTDEGETINQGQLHHVSSDVASTSNVNIVANEAPEVLQEQNTYNYGNNVAASGMPGSYQTARTDSMYSGENTFNSQPKSYQQYAYNSQGAEGFDPNMKKTSPNPNYGFTPLSVPKEMPGFSKSQREPAKKKKSSGKFKKIVAIALSAVLFGIVSAGTFYGTNMLLEKHAPTHEKEGSSTEEVDDTDKIHLNTDSQETVKPADKTETGENLDVATIADNCLPSIVAITNLGVSDVTTFFGTYQQESQSAGSGIIIGQTDDELIILTNYHVVESSNQLTVVFSFDEKNENPDSAEAHLKGFDANRDVAVIAIKLENLKKDVLSKIKVAVIGDSKSLVLGQQVVAIGNALGYGQSVTTGIVSALDREVSLQNSDGTVTNNKYIQTDAAINPGNSGGALLNMNGELIGINSAKSASNNVEGMGYAIPISDVKELIEDLMNRETLVALPEEDQGYMCISGSSVDAQAIAMHVPAGVLISEVYEGYAAAEAGLKKGDIICEINGISIGSMEDMKAQLSYIEGGTKVKVKYARYDEKSGAYKEKETKVKLATYEDFKEIAKK